MKKGNEMSGLGIAMSSSSFASDLFESSSVGQSSDKKGWFNMKKLMFVAAAALCASAFADGITSANVVGYANTTGDQGTYKLMGASFLSVGNADKKVGISTLNITGYETSEYLYNYGNFSASFQVLNGDGSPKNTYFYENTSDDGEVWNGAKWTDEGGNEINSDNEKWLKSGDGIWLTMPGAVELDNLSLTSSGQVFAGDCGVEGDQGTYRAICNPLPATVKLSECEIQGYEDSEYLYNYGNFSASFQILNGDGSPKNTYFYENTSDDGEVWNGAKWTDEGGNEITSENDLPLPLGQGLWITMPGAVELDCVSMVFPKVID